MEARQNYLFLALMTSTPQSLKNQEGCLSFRNRILTQQLTYPFSHFLLCLRCSLSLILVAQTCSCWTS